MLKRCLKRIIGGALRLVPLDVLLLLSQRTGKRIASILMFRDWWLEAYGRPQFFKHEINLSLWRRSEEHTSELQSQSNLVCRLLLEKKKKGDRLAGVRTDRSSLGDLLLA